MILLRTSLLLPQLITAPAESIVSHEGNDNEDILQQLPVECAGLALDIPSIDHYPLKLHTNPDEPMGWTVDTEGVAFSKTCLKHVYLHEDEDGDIMQCQHTCSEHW